MSVISGLNFSVLSPEKIRSISVVEVITDELYEKNEPKRGGLRDPKFGVSGRRGVCESCELTWSECAGHFGHFELPVACYHNGWILECMNWLRRSCPCGFVQNLPLGKKCPECDQPTAKIRKKNSTSLTIEDKGGFRVLTASEARERLQAIPDYNVHNYYTGPDAKFHPIHLILTVLPIPPNCVRPSPTLDGDEVRGEDDITRRLLYVIRIAKATIKSANENSIVRKHAEQRLQDAVHMYIDQRKIPGNTRASQKSISERLVGKEGRMRGSLMGKRCNYTARTVITGDAMLDMREVGVPRQVA